MVDVKTKIAELEIIAGSPVICVESTAFLTVLKLRDIPSYYVYDKEMELVGVFSHYNTTSTTRYRVVGVGQGIFGVINWRGNLVIPMEFKCLKPLDKNGLYWRFSRDMRGYGCVTVRNKTILEGIYSELDYINHGTFIACELHLFHDDRELKLIKDGKVILLGKEVSSVDRLNKHNILLRRKDMLCAIMNVNTLHKTEFKYLWCQLGMDDSIGVFTTKYKRDRVLLGESSVTKL